MFSRKCFPHFLVFGVDKKYWSPENDFQVNNKFTVVGRKMAYTSKAYATICESHFLKLVSPTTLSPNRNTTHHRKGQLPLPPKDNPLHLSATIPLTLSQHSSLKATTTHTKKPSHHLPPVPPPPTIAHNCLYSIVV
jgi:hypothetical protein